MQRQLQHLHILHRFLVLTMLSVCFVPSLHGQRPFTYSSTRFVVSRRAGLASLPGAVFG